MSRPGGFPPGQFTRIVAGYSINVPLMLFLPGELPHQWNIDAVRAAGTLDYMSPEQVEARPVDGRADQYALACTAFELLAGEPPFGWPPAMGVSQARVSRIEKGELKRSEVDTLAAYVKALGADSRSSPPSATRPTSSGN